MKEGSSASGILTVGTRILEVRNKSLAHFLPRSLLDYDFLFASFVSCMYSMSTFISSLFTVNDHHQNENLSISGEGENKGDGSHSYLSISFHFHRCSIA